MAAASPIAEVVNKRNDDNDLIVAASSATSTRLAQGAFPGNTMDQVRWVASVGADYGIIAVAKDLPINTLPELMDKIKADPTSVSVAGGSAVGGWDHLKVLIAARKAGIDDVRQIKYVAFDGGGEAVTQLLGGLVQAFTGDASEAKGFVDSGDIKVIAVLAPERLPGDFAKLPDRQGTGHRRGRRQLARLLRPGRHVATTPTPSGSTPSARSTIPRNGRSIMAANGLAPLDLRGEEFQKFVAENVAGDPGPVQAKSASSSKR